MRTLIILSIIALASCNIYSILRMRPSHMPTQITGKQKLQEFFNGLWEFANLTDPTQMINCFDEPTANNTITYIGQQLLDVEESNRDALIQDTKNFVSTFPAATSKCMVGDSELSQLASAYNITNQPYAQVLAEIVKFITGNLQNVQQMASSGYFNYRQGMYTQVGNVYGQFLQQVFSSSSKSKSRLDFSELLNKVEAPRDAKSDLQNLMNGIFQDVQLPDPTTPINCFNQTTAQITLDFFASIISDIASNNYPQLVREYEVYRNALPQNVTNCIETDQQLDAAYDAYGFDSQTPVSLLQAYAKYYVVHHANLLNTTNTIDSDISDDDYFQAGVLSGNLVLAILSGSP